MILMDLVPLALSPWATRTNRGLVGLLILLSTLLDCSVQATVTKCLHHGCLIITGLGIDGMILMNIISIAPVQCQLLRLIPDSWTIYPFTNITWLVLNQKIVYVVFSGTEV